MKERVVNWDINEQNNDHPTYEETQASSRPRNAVIPATKVGFHFCLSAICNDGDLLGNGFFQGVVYNLSSGMAVSL